MTIHFREIQDEILVVLRRHDRRFLTAYQICNELSEQFPETWARIVAEYTDHDQAIIMGQGAGYPYSPASFVANALRFFSDQEGSNVVQNELASDGLSIQEVSPSPSANFLGIWAVRT